jgi:cell division protein FtsB
MSTAKLLKIILIAILAILTISSFQKTIKFLGQRNLLPDARSELERLRKEEERLIAQKKEIEKIEYIERVARDNLGLAKPGETVVVLPPDDILRQLAPPTTDKEDLPTLPKPIWKRWIELFF